MPRIKNLVPAFITVMLIFSCFIPYAGTLMRANQPGLAYARADSEKEKQSVPAADAADTGKDIYIVMTIVIVIWVGLSLFIFNLDRKLSRLEKTLDA